MKWLSFNQSTNRTREKTIFKFFKTFSLFFDDLCGCENWSDSSLSTCIFFSLKIRKRFRILIGQRCIDWSSYQRLIDTFLDLWDPFSDISQTVKKHDRCFIITKKPWRTFLRSLSMTMFDNFKVKAVIFIGCTDCRSRGRTVDSFDQNLIAIFLHLATENDATMSVMYSLSFDKNDAHSSVRLRYKAPNRC